MALTNHQIILICVIIFLSLIPLITGVAFLFWHKIIRFVTKKVYSVKFPHKIICAVIHYPANKIDRIYKIVPDSKKLGIGNGDYHFSQNNLESQKELHDKVIYIDKKKRLYFKYEAKFDGMIKENMTKEEFSKLQKSKTESVYYVNEDMISIDRGDNKIPEVHYWYNNPNPIVFDFANEKLTITAKDVRGLIESETAQKLLKLAQQNLQMLLIIVLICICIAVTGFNVFKTSQLTEALIKAGLITKSFILVFAVPYIKAKRI